MRLKFQRFPGDNLVYKIYRERGTIVFIKKAKADKSGINLEVEIIPEGEGPVVKKIIKDLEEK